MTRRRVGAPTVAISSLVLLYVLSSVTRAAAQPAGVVWNGPPDCAELGQDDAPVPEGTRAEVLVVREVDELSLRLDAVHEGRSYHREIRARSCDALRDFVRVFLSMVADVRPGQSSRASEAQSRDEEPTPPRGTPSLQDSHRPPLAAYLGAGGGLVLGVLPRARGAVVGRLELAGSFWRATLDTSWTREAESRLDDASGAAIRMFDVGLAGAFGVPVRRPRGALWFGGTGRVSSGRLVARGFGVDEARSDASAWFAAALGVRAEWQMRPRLRMSLTGEALVPLTRPRFLLRGSAIHRARAVSARILLALDIRLSRPSAEIE